MPEPAEPTRALPRPPNRRVELPTLLQMEAVECGAAALGIVLAYHGRIVPLEELRVQCGVSRDGSKAAKILRAAREHYGLIAKGFKYETEDLYQLQFPVILFWNLNHFLVLGGFRNGKVYLSDPAEGPRTVTLEELDSSFSGVVLTFEPGPDFKRGGEKPSLLGALVRRLEGTRAALAYVLLCGLFLVVPGLMVPTFLRIFVDDYLIGSHTAIVRPLLLVMAATAVVNMALSWLREYYLLRLETRLAVATSSRFFQHVLRLPVTYFAQRYAGEIGSRVMINDRVARVVGGRLATTIVDCVMVVFYAVLMFLYDVVLSVLVIGLALLNAAAVRASARLRTDASRRLMTDQGKLVGTAMNGIQSIETLKATGGEGEFFARWAGYRARALQSEQKLQLSGDLIAIIPQLINLTITAVILLVGGLKVIDGQLTIGLLVAYQALAGLFTKPLENFVKFGSTLQELAADLNRLDDVLSYRQDRCYEHDPPLAEGAPTKLQGWVELRNVSFAYSPLDEPLIKDFSLTIEPGQRVALVGSSGSGKSTVAKLIAGLYQPREGQILFDGVPREQLSHRLLTNSLGVVDQEIFLFGGTIKENVSMWDATIEAAGVMRACRDAAIDDVIAEREGTYQSRVSEGGGNFSGGQRQRLEIARALAGDPTVLILDEATSALDPTTEERIDDHLRRRGCTCILVAHRLSTIRDCDQIIVMDRGKIVDRGTHEEMKDAGGPYARLILGEAIKPEKAAV